MFQFIGVDDPEGYFTFYSHIQSGICNEHLAASPTARLEETIHLLNRDLHKISQSPGKPARRK